VRQHSDETCLTVVAGPASSTLELTASRRLVTDVSVSVSTVTLTLTLFTEVAVGTVCLDHTT